ncbi:MAG: hypothetical protein HFF50_10790 [Lawsonibacter sp.]|nr:hypothetical protein [Lawsonibacter sp.]
MQDLLMQLSYILSDNMQIPPPRSPEYQAAVNRLSDLEMQLLARVEPELLVEYQKTEYALTKWDVVDAFSLGLRFSLRLLPELLGPQSLKPSV